MEVLRMKWFTPACQHDWVTAVNQYDASPLERLKGAGLSKLKGGKSDDMKYLTQGTRIIILKCAVCGKLDKTVRKV